jgi:hypothetical protein
MYHRFTTEPVSVALGGDVCSSIKEREKYYHHVACPLPLQISLSSYPRYRIPNGPGLMSSMRHDSKKHGSNLVLGTIDSVPRHDRLIVIAKFSSHINTYKT